MIARDNYQRLFPIWNELNQDAQMKRADLVYLSTTKVNNKAICLDCVDAGKATFQCALCHQTYPTSGIQQIFGDPPDYLCKPCYGTVTAKEWEKKVNELDKEHEYDFR
jgi:hypothetical protein